MADSATFDNGTDRIDVVERHSEHGPVRSYRGRLRDEPVRVFALAPDASEAVASAFEQTVREWQAADCPGVVSVQARGNRPRPWLAIESRSTAVPAVVETLSLAEKQRVLADVAETLALLDREGTPPLVEPSLVRVVESGTTVSAKIEWPLVRACRTAAGESVVTPYTPPELLDDGAVTVESAVYAFGALAAYTLTGHPPVQAENLRAAIRSGQRIRPTSVDTSLPSAVDDVVATAMARDSDDRYDSCYECKLAVMFDTTAETSTGATQGDVTETTRGDVTATPPAAMPANEQVTAESTDETDKPVDETDTPLTRRRTVLGALGVGVAGAVVGGGLVATSVLRDTPTHTGATSFQYDRANTGYAPDETGPVTDASVEWRVDTGESVGSSPAVVDDTVYIGSVDTNVYALDSTDGAIRWQVEVDAEVSTSPAVADNTVYLQTRRRNEVTGTTYALDGDSGETEWTFDAGGFTTPIPAEDAVFTGGRDGLYALDPADGTELWSIPVSPSNLAPAFVDEMLYFGGTRDGERVPLVAAIDATDGSERWSRRFQEAEFPPLSSPAVVDGRVYAGVDRRLLAFDAEDGTEVWSVETGSRIASSPAVTDDTVYIHGGANQIHALDRATGEKRWEAPGGQNPVSSPAVVGETLYIGIDNSIASLDTADGTERWSFETDGAVVSSPAVVDGTLFVGSGDGSIYALTEADDRPIRPG